MSPTRMPPHDAPLLTPTTFRPVVLNNIGDIM
jgi:hypothetical protein